MTPVSNCARGKGAILAHRKEELPVLERVALEVRNAVRDEAADALLEAVHGVECADDESLFLALVPHRGEEDERWLADALEHPEQGAHDHKPGEVLAGSGAREDGTPRGDTVRSG